MMKKLKVASGLFKEILFIVIMWTQSPTVHAERRIISCSNEVHRRYQKYTYIIGCVVRKSIDDYWNVDGEKELSDAWTGFTRFILLNERPLDGYVWTGGETHEETNNL